jgi:hypothetical protein
MNDLARNTNQALHVNILPSEDSSIFSNCSHLGWNVYLTDNILKGNNQELSKPPMIEENNKISSLFFCQNKTNLHIMKKKYKIKYVKQLIIMKLQHNFR